MSLRTVVRKSYAEKYVFPAGWMTQEQAAADLMCSEDKVDGVLRIALADGSVQREYFQVWDRNLERVVKRVGYRERPREEKPVVTDYEGRRLMTRKTKMKGTVRGGKVHWDNGRVTTPDFKSRFYRRDYLLIDE